MSMPLLLMGGNPEGGSPSFFVVIVPYLLILFGTVVGVQDDSVVLRVADNVKVKFLKAKVAGRVTETVVKK